MARGPAAWAALRERLTAWLTDDRAPRPVEPHLLPRAEVTLHLPIEVADYVDFYSSAAPRREPRPHLPPGLRRRSPPNWKHLPIGYHGRAGTVAVSGTPVVRPCGQRKAPATTRPTFGPSAAAGHRGRGRLRRRRAVPARARRCRSAAFAEHVFGVCLVNDWSARDLQAWEYVPLGPFLGKSFLTSISPWVVPLAALEAARVPPPARDPPPLPYLGRRRARGVSTSPSRSGSTARWSAGRRSPGCTGRRPSSSPT